MTVKNCAATIEMAGKTWNQLDLGPNEFGQGAEAMRARLQHYLNSWHIYCRLMRYVSKARARQWAQSWETVWLYKHLVYPAKQKESELIYSESIEFDELNVHVYLWEVGDNERHN